jgi:predicted alpha-1,6-mannanase (GH76 family)
MLVRYSAVTDSQTYLPLIDKVFERNRQFTVSGKNGKPDATMKNFLNEYYDDEGWWALAWIDAYRLTKQKKYLEMAQTIFADMTSGYDKTCGGGIYWKKPQLYKNAIANSLFMLVALRLHQDAPKVKIAGKKPLKWGEMVWQWFRETGMINRQTWLVEDGLKDCEPNRNQNWTYNQGVPIAVMCELYRIKKDKEALHTAEEIARAAMSKMTTPQGVLKEKNEPDTGADGSQFKGIFIRHLALLYQITKKEDYKAFILKNAESIWANGREPNSAQFGGVWAGPFDRADASRQSCALDCLIEAMSLLKGN